MAINARWKTKSKKKMDSSELQELEINYKFVKKIERERTRKNVYIREEKKQKNGGESSLWPCCLLSTNLELLSARGTRYDLLIALQVQVMHCLV